MQEELLQLIYSPNQWTWFVLCVVMLILEALGAAGFLIGIAIGCFLTGTVVAIYGQFSAGGAGWESQILLVSITSSIFTILYWRYFRAEKQVSSLPQLNNKMAQMIGRQIKIESDIDFEGTVRIGDTVWKVRCPEPVIRGCKVTIIDTEGSVLIIK